MEPILQTNEQGSVVVKPQPAPKPKIIVIREEQTHAEVAAALKQMHDYEWLRRLIMEMIQI